MSSTFDPERLVRLDFHGRDQRFAVRAYSPLGAALAGGVLSPDAPLLHTDRGGAVYAFQTRHFSLYNVLSGTDALGQPWVATFCAICNAGMSFSPVVNGVTYTFYGAGFYDGMTVLGDLETDSCWDHLTGECISGPLRGARLHHLANLLHTTAGALAAAQPTALLAHSPLDAGRAPLEGLAESIRTAPEPVWLPQLHGSMVTAEDERLPRFEMGLGVWSVGGEARFYPFRTINAHDNLLIDAFEGRRLLIYIDPDTSVPEALYTESGSAAWRGETIVLDDGQTVRAGRLTQRGEAQPVERPLQLFQRWYGFAATFPGCAVYRR